MLLLQEFDLEIKDKKGSDNVIVYHLSRLERAAGTENVAKIAEIFPDEQPLMLSVQTPWYADIVNYLGYGIMPCEFSYQQKRKLRTNCRLYRHDHKEMCPRNRTRWYYGKMSCITIWRTLCRR